jgi:hypothetical protein
MIGKDELQQQLFDERFGALCEKWYALLQLCQWSIAYEMSDTVDDDHRTQAMCRVSKELGHKAKITFAEKMAYESEPEREELVIHELLHIHLDELAQYVYQYLPEEHQDYCTRLFEIAVSDLARILMVLGCPENAD